MRFGGLRQQRVVMVHLTLTGTEIYWSAFVSISRYLFTYLQLLTVVFDRLNWWRCGRAWLHLEPRSGVSMQTGNEQQTSYSDSPSSYSVVCLFPTKFASVHIQFSGFRTQCSCWVSAPQCWIPPF